MVVREINRGGLAVVYEAIDTANEGEGVALKCMDLRPLTSSAAAVTRAHVEREIRNASSFHHRNIINLLNVFADGNHLVIVLELVRGKDLLELINEGGGFLDDATARRYFKQLLEGVDFLHKKGFAHRDIKPENCMVETRKDRLVIIDFGLSKHLTSAKTLGVGTPDYMAPELIRTDPLSSGGKAYDAALADVWSMGVTLYLMAAGVYPFEDGDNPRDVSATLRNVCFGNYRPLPKRLEGTKCEELIKHMLQPNVRRRLSLEEVRNHEWLMEA